MRAKIMTLAVATALLVGCGVSKKHAALLDKGDEGFNISALDDVNRAVDSMEFKQMHQEDTMVLAYEYLDDVPDTLEAGELVLKNIKDEETGEEMLVDRIKPSLIVARFAQRQERGGIVPIDFEVRVPEQMIDRNWQVRLYPDLLLLNSRASENYREVLDSSRLGMMVLSGDQYLEKQLRGYERYERYLNSIVTDSTSFQYRRLLEIFLERNIPNVYRFKNDSSYVSEEAFVSALGVDDQKAVEHYTRSWARNRNIRKAENSDKAFGKMVRNPRPEGEIYLDTVYHSNEDGMFVYKYSTQITTKGRPTLNKALVYLSGDIYDGSERIYEIQRTDSLDYPISSVVEFVRDTVVYKVIWVPTHLADNCEYSIAFEVGKSQVDLSRGRNASQVREIRGKVAELLHNEKYLLDSIVVTATASPDGPWKSNAALSDKRGTSVSNLIVPFAEHYRDSLNRARRKALEESRQIVLDYDEEGKLREVDPADPAFEEAPRIKFITRPLPEYWEKLGQLVEDDLNLSQEQKSQFAERMRISDPDARERQMKRDSYYACIKDYLYPQLRIVRFDFMLHRKETVQEMIVTDEPDETYMAGLEALKNRDWETGIDLLRDGWPDDYNLGVAYLMMDRNINACRIFEAQPRTSDVCYMLALAYFRLGREQDALEAFKESCRKEPQKFWRGGKDGEINYLINKYDLHYGSAQEDAEKK